MISMIICKSFQNLELGMPPGSDAIILVQRSFIHAEGGKIHCQCGVFFTRWKGGA
ncbi:hypothetical protein DSECCO2_551180 [anaerobic digester metagenome]